MKNPAVIVTKGFPLFWKDSQELHNTYSAIPDEFSILIFIFLSMYSSE